MANHKNCQGIRRRDCLQLGLGSLLAGGLVGALRAAAKAAPGAPVRRQADSCILVWMDGGPTHYETFDPKPEAAVEIRGEWVPLRPLWATDMTQLVEIDLCNTGFRLLEGIEYGVNIEYLGLASNELDTGIPTNNWRIMGQLPPGIRQPLIEPHLARKFASQDHRFLESRSRAHLDKTAPTSLGLEPLGQTSLVESCSLPIA